MYTNAKKLTSGTSPYKEKLTPKQVESAIFILPYITEAVKIAEGSDKYVKSLKTSNPEKVLKNSIVNNFSRWIDQKREDTLTNSTSLPFVRFMRQRWAPSNVKNDPTNLNSFWTENVRRALFDDLGGEEYNRWKKYNMV